VSTFSVDVDTASYAFMRASLNNGALPPKDSIRVEEWINYFDYSYGAGASADAPFGVDVAVMPAPLDREWGFRQ
jgi:Ca-activated chloride channel family protein